MVVRGKVEKGLFVDLVDSEVQAFLPKEHLSDHLLNCELLHAIYTTGDQIEDCAVFSTDKRIVSFLTKCLNIYVTLYPLSLLTTGRNTVFVMRFLKLKKRKMGVYLLNRSMTISYLRFAVSGE